MAGMMGGMELGMGQPSTGMYAGPYPGHAGGRGGVRHAAAPLAAAALKGAHTQTPYAAFLQHASHAAPLQRMPEGFYQPRVDSRSGFRDLSSDAELHPSSHPIWMLSIIKEHSKIKQQVRMDHSNRARSI